MADKYGLPDVKSDGLVVYCEPSIIKAVEHSQKVLSKVGINYLRAAKSSLSRTSMTAKTEAGRNVPKEYRISKSTFMANTRFETKNPTIAGNGLDMAILYKGKNMPDKLFPVKKIDRGHSIEVERGRPTHVVAPRGAFQTTMKNGASFLARRKGRERKPIRRVLGISGATMMVNEKVNGPVQDKIFETFSTRMDHEIYRLLMGFGK